MLVVIIGSKQLLKNIVGEISNRSSTSQLVFNQMKKQPVKDKYRLDDGSYLHSVVLDEYPTSQWILEEHRFEAHWPKKAKPMERKTEQVT